MASGSLDLLATQRGSGHDERATEPDTDTATGRVLRLPASRPELFLAVPDEVVQDAGVRWKHHRLNTVPSSDQCVMFEQFPNACDIIRRSSYDVNPFEHGSLATMQP